MNEYLVNMVRPWLSDGFEIKACGRILSIGLPYASKEMIDIDLENAFDLEEDEIRQEVHDRIMEYLGSCFLR